MVCKNLVKIFEGINNSLIIQDNSNLNNINLTKSLKYQKLLSVNKKRILISVDELNKIDKFEEIKKYSIDTILKINSDSILNIDISDSIILLRGKNIEKIINQIRLKTHKTYLQIDLDALRNNIELFKSIIPKKTNLISVVKANSYGIGSKKMSNFLQLFGVDYFAVGCIDEGITLRKEGITLPIMVLNPDFDSLDSCIKYNLEPTIYSFKSLDMLLKLKIENNFPIHIKVQTGMKRIGFELDEIEKLIKKIKNTNFNIKTIYSHLSDTDNVEYTNFQISQFNKHFKIFKDKLSYPVKRHILNTEGIISWNDYCFEYVRLGLGVYGNLKESLVKSKSKPVVSWWSKVSQIKSVDVGESVGYDRYFIADKKTTIATIPVGYADGFKRNLSSGVGSVYINDEKCPVVGRVCMDMIMVDITNKIVKEGDLVEIIGPNQTAEELAKDLNTIVDELFTGISDRVSRIFIDNYSSMNINI